MKKSRTVYLKDYRSTPEYGFKRSYWISQNLIYYDIWNENHPGYAKTWQRNNRAHYISYQNQWRILNREKWNAYMKDYMQKYRARKKQELS